jgi:hypothetical protein
MTTTTNLAGIEIPNDAIEEAAIVADALDAALPAFLALLDRATAAMTAIELPALRETRMDRTDEQGEAIRTRTAYLRLEDHFYALNARTDDRNILSPEYHAELEALYASLNARD